MLEPRGFDFAVVTVTDRELGGSDFSVELKHLTSVAETALWNEGLWDEALWAEENDDRGERILAIIGNNSFPPPGKRENITPAQRRQLRDALMFHAHIRDHRDIFVTKDQKAFVNHGRRGLLGREFSTRIMTRAEFTGHFCDNPRSGCEGSDS